MREFFIPELEDRKIPNWMARIRLFPGDVTLEGIFIPFFEENEFDFSGTTWALLGAQPSDLRIDESKPGKGQDNSDLGLRTSTSLAGWDVALSYLHAIEKSPRLRFEPTNPQVRPCTPITTGKISGPWNSKPRLTNSDSGARGHISTNNPYTRNPLIP